MAEFERGNKFITFEKEVDNINLSGQKTRAVFLKSKGNVNKETNENEESTPENYATQNTYDFISDIADDSAYALYSLSKKATKHYQKERRKNPNIKKINADEHNSIKQTQNAKRIKEFVKMGIQVTKETIKVIAEEIKSLTAAIIAGGWVSVIIILIIILFGSIIVILDNAGIDITIIDDVSKFLESLK